MDFTYEHYDSIEEMSAEDRELVYSSQRATETANAHYSHFNVGAAARLKSGRIMCGSNFESEVFPAGLCAERSLLFYLQANHADDPIETLAIASQPSEKEGTPIAFILRGAATASVVDTAAKLLPFTFKLD